MGIYLNPGNDGFKRAVRSEIYVDKTGLIAYANSVLDTEKEFICVSRPRRFGKSMAANMLCAYYSKGCHSKELFSKLEISQNESFETHLNQYDVIFLNIPQFLRRVQQPEELAACIEERILSEIRETYPDFADGAEKSLPDTLASVYEKIKGTEKGFIFIIDEWDCLFREKKESKEAQKLYLDFLRDLLKDRTYVKLAYMTGILPIKKYGTHSALNIFDEFSMTNPKRLARYTGFTEDEVKGLCEIYGLDFEEAKRWYDGYCFRRIEHIYNPKSIVDAMLEEAFHSYWTSTETYEALKIYIDMNFDGLKDAIIAMLGGIHCEIDTGTFQNDMMSFHGKDDVLTLLIHLGYLAYNEAEQKVFIPNEEVRGEFLRAIRQSRWREVVDAVECSAGLLEATLEGNSEAVAEGLDKIH